MQIENDIVKDISFIGAGCAVSIASASMMTENLKGKTEAEVKALFERFQQLTTNSLESHFDPATMGELAVFAGIQKYPVRVKCATLAWHTMQAALERLQGTVATE
jgi:nitrogen fixation NifU-like protein